MPTTIRTVGTLIHSGDRKPNLFELRNDTIPPSRMIFDAHPAAVAVVTVHFSNYAIDIQGRIHKVNANLDHDVTN